MEEQAALQLNGPPEKQSGRTGMPGLAAAAPLPDFA